MSVVEYRGETLPLWGINGETSAEAQKDSILMALGRRIKQSRAGVPEGKVGEGEFDVDESYVDSVYDEVVKATDPSTADFNLITSHNYRQSLCAVLSAHSSDIKEFSIPTEAALDYLANVLHYDTKYLGVNIRKPEHLILYSTMLREQANVRPI